MAVEWEVGNVIGVRGVPEGQMHLEITLEFLVEGLRN